MPPDFPKSPKIPKGTLVAYQLLELLPTIIVFQYNPEQLARSHQGRTTSGGRTRRSSSDECTTGDDFHWDWDIVS